MAEKTNNPLADASVNFWQGCTKQGRGCDSCFMYRQKEAYQQTPDVVVRSKPNTFNLPLKLKEPQRVMVCSWSDFFVPEADEWRRDAWEIIHSTPHLTYLISTRFPQRITACLPADWGSHGYGNVWLMTSVEDDASYRTRVPELLAAPARVRGLVVEPYLSPIAADALRSNMRDFQFVVIGGETGEIGTKYNPRPFPMESAVEIVQMCAEFGVPCFVKAMGTLWAKQHGDPDDKGGTLELFPEPLRVREFPEVAR